MPWQVAVMLVIPWNTPVATPATTVALVGSEDAQIAVELRSKLLPSLKWPVTVNAGVLEPTNTLALPPPSVTEVRVGAAGLLLLQPTKADKKTAASNSNPILVGIARAPYEDSVGNYATPRGRWRLRVKQLSCQIDDGFCL
jgi:hypothetical protein